jgi:glycerophosphoryl diester phosphodiesterase
LDRDVELVAHQGEEHLAPSHTQAAYNLAVAHGLDYMKLDLHETKDGVIVTQHDADLKRTYGVDIAIRETDFSKASVLKAIPVGGYSNETVCTLAKALEISKPMKGLWLDFKQFSPEFMDRVFAEVAKSGWPTEKLIVATFNHWALKWAPRKRPGIRLVAHTKITKEKGGYTLNYGEKGKVYPDEDSLADAILAYAKKMKLYGVNMPAPHRWRKNRYATTPKMIRRLKDAGLWVSIWFVNNPENGSFYRDCHADAFVTACAGNTAPSERKPRPENGK